MDNEHVPNMLGSILSYNHQPTRGCNIYIYISYIYHVYIYIYIDTLYLYMYVYMYIYICVNVYVQYIYICVNVYVQYINIIYIYIYSRSVGGLPERGPETYCTPLYSRNYTHKIFMISSCFPCLKKSSHLHM